MTKNDDKRDAVLLRMLKTPPKPHKAKRGERDKPSREAGGKDVRALGVSDKPR